MIESFIGEIQKGKPFLVFDDEKREGETDMMLPSQFMTPDIVRKMRREGGGLICLSLREKDAVRIGLPYLETILPQTGVMKGLFRNDDLKYDSSSAFSLTINTRNSFTGITDIDRSSTIREFASFLSDLGRFNGTASSIFADRFRSPGHVFLLIARDGYFSKRRGHTELGTYLVEKAGLIPSVTMVEMLSDTGRAMTRDEALDYATKNKLTFIDGKTIIESWSNETGHGNGGL